jgi:hypothetical protein
MYESRHEPLLPRRKFALRLAGHSLVTIGIITLGVGFGMAGYRFLEHQPWLDSLLNASMLFTGEGPDYSPQTSAGKLFVSFYGLVCIILLMSCVGVLFAPIIHRGFHKFHLDQSARRGK